MKKFFKLKDEMVKFAKIGIESAAGFSGLQIVMQDGRQNEVYFANGEVIKSRQAGEMDELDYQDIKRRLNVVRYNLLEDVRKTMARTTVTHFEAGFKNGVIYYDSDMDLLDNDNVAEEPVYELIQDGSMYETALKCAVTACNNLDYDRGPEHA